MQAYQLGATKFDANETLVFGISTDNTPSQKEFATKLSLPFPLLSDFVDRKVAEKYGVLIAAKGYANRVSFVIDKEGKITYIETGKLDINGTDDACSRLAHRSGEKN
jgi:peroxiredoxin